MTISNEPIATPDELKLERQRRADIFQRSPLKQQKLHEILRLLPDNLAGLRCLDLGADNGIISYLLRQLGGEWSSSDLTAETCESIRYLVGERVARSRTDLIPFPDSYFDIIVIVDILEHVEDDTAFCQELKRILKPEGTLIVNVPNPPRGPIRFIKHLIGQGDLAHGHLRPGYSVKQLQKLLGPEFTISESSSYRRAPLELLDMAVTFALEHSGTGARGQKGVVVSASSKKAGSIGIAARITFPLFGLLVKLDHWLRFMPGHLLIVKANRST